MATRDNNEHQSPATTLALLGQRLEIVLGELTEIKTELRDQRAFYATKEELVNSSRDLQKQMDDIQRRVSNIYKFGSAILLAITSAMALAFVKIVGPHL